MGRFWPDQRHRFPAIVIDAGLTLPVDAPVRSISPAALAATMPAVGHVWISPAWAGPVNAVPARALGQVSSFAIGIHGRMVANGRLTACACRSRLDLRLPHLPLVQYRHESVDVRAAATRARRLCRSPDQHALESAARHQRFAVGLAVDDQAQALQVSLGSRARPAASTSRQSRRRSGRAEGRQAGPSRSA
jgi:hypothetical protein